MKKDQKPKIKYGFDKYGRFVPIKPKIAPMDIAPSPGHIRIPPLEKIIKYWRSINPDYQFHMKAVMLCICCFSYVYIPTIVLGDWFNNFEVKANVEEGLLDKEGFKHYMYKKFGLDYDPFLHFQSV